MGDHGPGRQKVRKSRAKGIGAIQITDLSVVQDMHVFLEVSKTAPVYPQVWICLFGDVTGSGEVRKSNKRDASRKFEELLDCALDSDLARKSLADFKLN